MEEKTIKQTIMFKATPHEVYEMLMDSKKHSMFSGEDAKISRKVGGSFSASGSYISGTNLKLVPDKKIVQKWRGSDWDKGVYSTVTFDFKKDKAGTKLEFTQEGMPPNQRDSLSQGWKDYYWDKMKSYIENSK